MFSYHKLTSKKYLYIETTKKYCNIPHFSYLDNTSRIV